MPTDPTANGPATLTTADATAALAALERDGGLATAVTLFDALPTVRVEEITLGRWRGGEIRTGHPYDGVLAASGWYGKQFDDAETVQPLLFSTPNGAVFPVDPKKGRWRWRARYPTIWWRVARRCCRCSRPRCGPAVPGPGCGTWSTGAR